MNSIFSSKENIVLQILPSTNGCITINNRSAPKNDVFVFIPKENGYINCPLPYFQKKCSLKKGHILDENDKQVALETQSLRRIVFSRKSENDEIAVSMPRGFEERIFSYFQTEIGRKEGFDCHAFVCFASKTELNYATPNFKYIKEPPQIGSIVVLSQNEDVPKGIKHWCIYLGDDLYISKFGISTKGRDSLVEIMSLSSMHELYTTSVSFVATPEKNKIG